MGKLGTIVDLGDPDLFAVIMLYAGVGADYPKAGWLEAM